MSEVILVIPPGGLARYVNLGMGYLAAVLEKRGVPVGIVDCVALGYTQTHVERILRRKRPRVVGISVYSTSTPQVYRLVKAIRASLPNTVIVLGGAHFQVMPEALQDFEADYAFHGDCEFGFADLCERELGGRALLNGEIKGLVYRAAGRTVVNEPARVDLDSLPFPARHLFSLAQYRSMHDLSGDGHAFSVISSRGCVNRCLFCCNLTRIVRYRSAENVVDELSHLHRMGARYVEFVDEMFVNDRGRILRICELLTRSRISIQWGMQTPVSTLNEALIKLLSASGCVRVSIGVESGVERIRKLVAKPIRNEALFELRRLCRNNGISLLAHYIFGHPTESPAEMRKTISFACRLDTDFADFNRCVILPGTRLFERAAAEGKIQKDHWRRFAFNETPLPLYIPDGVTLGHLNRIHRRALLAFYLRPRYMARKARALFSPGGSLRLFELMLMFIRIVFRKSGVW